MNHDAGYPRVAGGGRSYVYLLPCRDEDLLKVGFSRDPLTRLRSLHPRFFEFFDLERGLLLELDRLRDARRIERLFIDTFVAERAPAPLAVRRAAGGHTEWYRGIHPAATLLARQLHGAEGLTLHLPLRDWLRRHFAASGDRLYDGCARLLELIEYERFNVPAPLQTGRAAQALGHLLDAYAAVGVPIEPLLPAAVWHWYRERSALVFDPR